ncbi:MAG: ImmA/IrrE family metallo-endopeptidase [Pirellulales bacterium]
MLRELTQDELAGALDAVASEALDAAAPSGPPIDALKLAQALALTVAWDDRQSGRGRVVRLGQYAGPQSRGSILLRHDPRPERLQWAIAHEIGELFAARVFARLAIDPREAPSGSRENVANQLAGRLLLPADRFQEAGTACGWDLFALKQQFSTASHELIARRMLDLPYSIAITIFDNDRRTFRRGNLPGRLPPLLPLERAAWRTARETGQAVAEADHLCRVQAWPVHEPEWKREILRTEWSAAEDNQASEAWLQDAE